MRICIVGGIFGTSVSYQTLVKWTPETVLAEGLADRGHDITVAGHSDSVAYSQFDLIHVHHLGRGAVTAALDRSKTPLVFTPHNDAATAPRRRALAFVLDRSDAVVDLSPSLRARRAPSLKSGVRHCVVPNGIPGDYLQARIPTPPDSGRPWELLYAGQLIPSKNVDILLRAFREVASRRPARLRLAYHIPDQEASLRAIAGELGITEKVAFVGPLDKRDLANAYRSSHFVVLPSSQEYLPSVLTEAMLCGTPVVATAVGAVAEQVGNYGVVVLPGTLESLVEGIELMIARYGNYCRLSGAMSAEMRTRYSVTGMIGAHESLYSVLAGKVARRASRSAVASLPVRAALSMWSRKHPLLSGVNETAGRAES